MELEKTCAGMDIEINDRCVTALLFADEQVIVANCMEALDFMLRKLTNEYVELGLQTITEYLCMGHKKKETQTFQINKLRKYEEYKYLGSLFSKDGTTDREINIGVQQCQKCVRILNSLL